MRNKFLNKSWRSIKIRKKSHLKHTITKKTSIKPSSTSQTITQSKVKSNTSLITVTSNIITKNIQMNTPIRRSRSMSTLIRIITVLKSKRLKKSNTRSINTKNQKMKFSPTKIIISRVSTTKQIPKRIITKTTTKKSTRSSSTTRKMKMSKRKFTSTNKARLNLLHKFKPKKTLLPLNERAEQFLLKI